MLPMPWFTPGVYLIVWSCLMIFEPALLKTAGNKSSQISSTFQHVVYFQGWEEHNNASTLKTSQIVGSRLNLGLLQRFSKALDQKSLGSVT